MYVLAAPCILDPSCRAHGITTAEDVRSFLRAIERCRRFSIEMVPLPCPETIYLGADREPGSFMERLATDEFSALLDALEAGVRNAIRERGEPPLAIVGVDSSPACGVNTTYRSSEKEPGRGAFIARFPDIRAIDVREFARYRVYLAAPLFSEAERAYNLMLRDLLEAHFFDPSPGGGIPATRCGTSTRTIFLSCSARDADIVVAVIDGADADRHIREMGYALGNLSSRSAPTFVSLDTTNAQPHARRARDVFGKRPSPDVSHFSSGAGAP